MKFVAKVRERRIKRGEKGTVRYLTIPKEVVEAMALKAGELVEVEIIRPEKERKMLETSSKIRLGCRKIPTA